MDEIIHADGESDSRPGVVVGYMCGVGYQHELGRFPAGILVYPSVADLKAYKPCWRQCGIVEVEVRATRWVEPPDL
jgi:hypothetical protein